MKKYATLIILGFIVLILQSAFAPIINIAGWTPDFLIILIFIISFRYNVTPALLYAFLLGLMQDLFVTDFVGLSAAANVVAAYTALHFKESVMTPGIFALGLLVVSLVKHLVYYFVLSFGPTFDFWIFLYSVVFPQSIYTLIIGVIIFFIFNNLILKEINNEF